MTGTIIHVGATPPAMQGHADYFDGQSAGVARVELDIQETENGPVLNVTSANHPTQKWPLGEIRSIPDQADRDTLVVALQGDPVSRLVVTDPATCQVLRARCRKLKKRPSVKGKVRLVAWAAAAVASVALIILVLVPLMADQLAEYLPPEGERALGETTFKQIRTAMSDNELLPIEVCENPAGVAALNKMQARLELQTDLPYPISVHVLDHDMVNAFALPGGQVVFFRGLIDEAENPDEVAAVFAHEIGHVVNRDPARGALRSAGSIGVLGLLFGDFAGGFAITFMVNRLIDATYSQDAEAGADVFAHSTLVEAGIPPSSLGTMFERLRVKYGDSEGIVAHFASHPKLGDRIAAAIAADANIQGAIQPSLTQDEWQALRDICR